MRSQVRRAALDRLDAALGVASVMLERLRRRDDDGHGRNEARGAAHDVDELLEAHVRPEAALGDDVVAELEPELVGEHGVVPVRDVGERAAMHDRRLTLERLDEVRLDRLAEQGRHRACRTERLGRHRLAFERRSDGNGARRSRRSSTLVDIATTAITSEAAVMSKPVSRGEPFIRPPSPITTRRSARSSMSTQRFHVIVSGSIPRTVAVEQMRLEHRREQIVRGPDRVDVAGEMEIDGLHRGHLGPASTGAASLDAENGA